MLVCREAARLISVSYHRPLRWREKMSLRMHLMMCDACRNFKNQMKLLSMAAKRFVLQEGIDSQLHLPEDARRRINSWLISRRGDT